jgi:hypothetical protein
MKAGSIPAALAIALVAATLASSGADAADGRASRTQVERAQPARQTAAAALPPLTDLAAWTGKSFFAPSCRERFVLVARAPGADPGWRAYGVDLSDRHVVFQIRLTTNDVAALSAQLAQQDAQEALRDPRKVLRSDTVSQLTLPPPPAPKGVDASAWLASRLIDLATQSLAPDTLFAPKR